MNVPFEFSAAPGAATAQITLLFDLTNNITLAGIITAAVAGTDNAGKLGAAGLGAVLTTADFFLRGLSVSVNAAMKIEFGLYKATGTVFCPLYTMYAGEAVAGGLVRRFDPGLKVLNEVAQGTSHWNAAVRFTPDAAGTVKLAGDVEIEGRVPTSA